jgi:hypothetical protein
LLDAPVFSVLEDGYNAGSYLTRWFYVFSLCMFADANVALLSPPLYPYPSYHHYWS